MTIHFAHTHPTLYESAPTPISIQLSFLRRTATGKAVLTVQDTKLGARTSTIHITLSQPREGANTSPDVSGVISTAKEEQIEVKVTGYITVSPPTAEVGVSAPTSWSLYPPAVPGSGPNGRVNLAALAAQGRDGSWVRLEHRYSPFRRAGQHIEIFGPGPVPGSSSSDNNNNNNNRRGIIDQWSRFRPGGDKIGRWTNEALGYLVDMFPVALEEVGALSLSSSSSAGDNKKETPLFWYPTVTLNVDVKKRLPPQGVEWLYSRVQSKAMRDGRTDFHVVVLDEEGEIVALASQVSLVLSASRNVGQRSYKGREKKL